MDNFRELFPGPSCFDLISFHLLATRVSSVYLDSSKSRDNIQHFSGACNTIKIEQIQKMTCTLDGVVPSTWGCDPV